MPRPGDTRRIGGLESGQMRGRFVIMDTRRIGGLEIKCVMRKSALYDTRRIGGLEKWQKRDTQASCDTRRIGGLEIGGILRCNCTHRYPPYRRFRDLSDSGTIRRS